MNLSTNSSIDSKTLGELKNSYSEFMQTAINSDLPVETRDHAISQIEKLDKIFEDAGKRVLITVGLTDADE